MVLALFQRLRRDRATTIVLVTHDEAVAAGADRVVHMVDGRVVADGAAVPGATELRPARPDVLWPGVSAMIRR